MAVSGVSNFDLQFDDLITEAYERCGIEVRDGYDMKTALRSVNLIFAEWANRGLYLWTIEQRQQVLTPGVYEYDLPAETEDNVWNLTDSERRAMGIEPLPQSLDHAIRKFEESELAAETLGEQVFSHMLANKRAEWAAYRTQVTPFELKRNLETL
jgi:hypothetical protein